MAVPSFNHGRYIEETIRSILLQGYPNLEVFVIDGGSKDETVSILRKYEPWLAGWVSEPDRGQSDAINKGFVRSTGDLFNWICSDDLLRPSALQTVAKLFASGEDCDVVAGSCYCDFEGAPEKNEVRPSLGDRFPRMPYAFAVWQPSCFFKRSLIARSELVRTDLVYLMDRELWCYFWSRHAKWKWCDDVLSVNRFTGNNKSTLGKAKLLEELEQLYVACVQERIPLTFWLRHAWLPLARVQRERRSAVLCAASRLLSRALSLSLHALYSRERVRVLQDEYYMYSFW